MDNYPDNNNFAIENEQEAQNICEICSSPVQDGTTLEHLLKHQRETKLVKKEEKILMKNPNDVNVVNEQNNEDLNNIDLEFERVGPCDSYSFEYLYEENQSIAHYGIPETFSDEYLYKNVYATPLEIDRIKMAYFMGDFTMIAEKEFKQCQLCPMETKTMGAHLETVHQIQLKAISCPFCSESENETLSRESENCKWSTAVMKSHISNKHSNCYDEYEDVKQRLDNAHPQFNPVDSCYYTSNEFYCQLCDKTHCRQEFLDHKISAKKLTSLLEE